MPDHVPGWSRLNPAAAAEQLYDGAEFEAYRALGEAVVLQPTHTRALASPKQEPVAAQAAR
jgi:hypothetical protein